ncbi:hypothetical protein K432DRAFT_405217 [Lepidopterella palustris CBS 459.81]|uniref:Uncharacterized protein n=1 Tax=Lepidopterella palustris CBS 459.81 TaxID=1314670 RepID=A0A8E2E9B2_9PEZI|nr:hypothetical protein K432DRAFT_405217 [Lepidopterella palustris CBS 459.81]
MQSLIQDVDEYIQAQQYLHVSTPSTIFLDFDGTTIPNPVIKRRSHSDYWLEMYDNYCSSQQTLASSYGPQNHHENPLSGAIVPRQQEKSKQRGSRMYGYDPDTEYSWDYDGRIMHIHKGDSDSEHSSYYEISPFGNFSGDWTHLHKDEEDGPININTKMAKPGGPEFTQKGVCFFRKALTLFRKNYKPPVRKDRTRRPTDEVPLLD